MGGLTYTAVLLGLTLFQLFVCVSSASSINLVDDNCTDCCSYLACSGMDYETNASSSIDDFFDHLCSKINIAVMPTCLSKSNLEGCSYMRKLLSAKIPSPEQISKSFDEMCNQRKVFGEMKNMSKCIESSGASINALTRCITPYMNGMKDPNSDLCDVMKTMSRCVVGILKATKCNEQFVMLNENYKNQMTMNPFCDTTTDGSQRADNNTDGSQRAFLHVGLFIITLLYYIL